MQKIDNSFMKRASLDIGHPGFKSPGQAAEKMGRPVETAIGAYCSETQRVAVISLFPERLRGLVGELTARCLDVLVFHRFDPAVMDGLPLELVVIDAAAAAEAGELAELQAAVADTRSRARFLWLVQENAPAADLANAETIVWPMPLSDAVQWVEELLSAAQAEAVTTPVATANGNSAVYTFKDLTLDPKKMTLSRGGKRVEVTKTEFELLLLLMQEGGAVLTREEIMDRVWGSQYFGGSNVVDVHVKSLRKKLGDPAAAPIYIVTVRGVGYRLADE